MKKKEKIIQKFMNIILSTYTLIYVSPKIIIFLEIFFKNIFPNFSQVSEFQWDNGDGDVGGDGDGDGQNFGCEIHRDYCQHI